MAEIFTHADYGQPDDAYAVNVLFIRKTAAELTALLAARRVGVGTVYFDTTNSRFKLGVEADTLSGDILISGSGIQGTPIGPNTRATGAFTTLALNTSNSTGTPGNVTNNNPNGRAAFAAAGSTVVVTNSSVAAADTVLVTLLGAADATLTNIVGVTVAAGSFTVTGNATATATKGFMFTVIKA